nr:hypothetical protein [Tanacetum cinerariifolium]
GPLRNDVLTSIWYTGNDLCVAYATNNQTAPNQAIRANDSSKSIPSCWLISHGFFDVLQFGSTHDDLLSNDVLKDVVDRMYACLTSQNIKKMSPLILVPVYKIC